MSIATRTQPTQAPAPSRKAARLSAYRLRRVEFLVGGLLAAAVFFVHDTPYMLRHPYWLDEAWVIVSTRAPLADLPRVVSATPLGWAVLLRLVPGASAQHERLVPLLFGAGTVFIAYLIGRELRLLGAVGGGLLTGAAALLVPAMLVRADLKPYTADAFVTVLLLFLVCRLETRWSRRRLAVVVGVAVLGLLFSHATAFAGTAALLSIALGALLTRAWRRLAEAMVAGVAGAVGMGVMYLLVDKRHETPLIRAYWTSHYVPTDAGWAGIQDKIEYLGTAILPYLGVGAWVLWTLAGVAIVTLVRTGRRVGTALMMPIVAIAMVVAAAQRRYPLLDQRTSTFLLVGTIVVLAIGVLGMARLAARAHWTLGVGVVAVAAVSYIHVASPYLRFHPLPPEDVRAQVRYVERHVGPNDVVLVNSSAGYGYGYYANSPSPQFPRTQEAANDTIGFVVGYPRSTRVIALSGRRAKDVVNGLRDARALACQTREPVIWIVRSHVTRNEAPAWHYALVNQRYEEVQVGPESLLRYTPTCLKRPGT